MKCKVQYINGEEAEYTSLSEATEAMEEKRVGGIVFDAKGQPVIFVTGFTYYIVPSAKCIKEEYLKSS